MQASPEIHLNVEKIKITDVPTDGDQLQAWLDQQFQKKDRYGLSLAIRTASDLSFCSQKIQGRET